MQWNTTLGDNLCIEGGVLRPDPEQDEEAGDGKDVIENRRQICIYKQANASGGPGSGGTLSRSSTRSAL